LTTLETKQHILDAGGFAYNFDRAVYFNRKKKKIFSVEFVQDHDESELERRIREGNGGKEWQFYFNSGEPPEEVRREIEAVIERGNVRKSVESRDSHLTYSTMLFSA
jgi:hypothetical protein